MRFLLILIVACLLGTAGCGRQNKRLPETPPVTPPAAEVPAQPEKPAAVPAPVPVPAPAVEVPAAAPVPVAPQENAVKEVQKTVLPPRLVASFEDGTPAPFSDGGEGKEVTTEHATEGSQALTWTNSYISWDGDQDWTGYDYLKADFFVPGGKPVDLYVEVRDRQTEGYWTRVNYNSVLMPGKNTLVLPCNQFVGEKSRPGRPLIQNAITRLVFSIDKSPVPVYLDNVRLECDDADRARFDGLHAFDFGLPASPLLRGMTRVTADTRYTPESGYGLKDAKVWRSFDVLQPDAVYRDFVCIEQGGFALDVPNGTYHVFVNTDCPGGYWGELPRFRERSITAEGQTVFSENMDRDKAVAKYFRFADRDDLYSENTFDKYLGAIFNEKEFDIAVADGQLNIEFSGLDWTNAVSCLVVFPADKMEAGRNYLASLRERRRFDFDNYFRRLLHYDENPEPAMPADDADRGYCIFVRDYMDDVYPDTKPAAAELTRTISALATAGEIEPLTFSIRAARDLGTVTVTPTDLKGPGTIPASAIKTGYVSNRISRVQMDGSVYTIKPRYVMNSASVALDAGTSRRFWTNVSVPAGTPAGIYKGALQIALADGSQDAVQVTLDVVSATPLPEPDLPVGPWGLEIRVPWFDEEMTAWNAAMDKACLGLMRQYGCTSFSSSLNIRMNGTGPAMTLDFAAADRMMATAKETGMLAFVNYGTAVHGLNLYGYPAPSDPKQYGFDDLTALYSHIFKLIDAHAAEAGWIPVYITACDEPIGDNLAKCAVNAALLKACATERIRFAGATSMSKGQDPDNDPHLPLVRSLDVANFNGHDTWSIGEARKSGGWAFYNGGNRWTYGFYMFMLRQKYDMAFRLSWHWNANAGDPYYALDCREDDYAWANADAAGNLITSLQFERLREGIDDYRYLLKLKRLVDARPGHPAAAEARQALDRVLALVPGTDRGKQGIGDSETGIQGLAALRKNIAELIRKMEKQ